MAQLSKFYVQRVNLQLGQAPFYVQRVNLQAVLCSESELTNRSMFREFTFINNKEHVLRTLSEEHVCSLGVAACGAPPRRTWFDLCPIC